MTGGHLIERKGKRGKILKEISNEKKKKKRPPRVRETKLVKREKGKGEEICFFN